MRTIAEPSQFARRLHGRGVALGSLWVLLGCSWAALGCEGGPFGGGEDGFSAEDWDRVLELEPLGIPLGASPFNEYADDPDAARLGQRLFFDKEFASAVRVAGP